MRLMYPRRPALSALVAGALVLGAAAAGTGAVGAAGKARADIPNTHPSWAVPGHGPGTAVTRGAVNLSVYLASPDAADLASYARAVSTPGSALYGHYLSAAQAQARYAPTQAEISAVEAWLQSTGLRVTGVSRGIGAHLSVSGSVAQAAAAFGVSFGTFRGPDGHNYRAPEQSASAPSAIAGDILAVSGLDTAPHFAKPQGTLPPPGPNYWVAPPCGQYYDQLIATNEPRAFGQHWPWNVCGYTPAQIRSVYGVTSSRTTGRGQTVAIVDAYASPSMPGDANRFAKVVGDHPFRPGQYRQYLSPFWEYVSECGGSGWYGEETLDIEAVHGQAPDANVRYVGAASCSDGDLLNALALIVETHLASIVSNSWGEPFQYAQPLVDAYDQVFEAGAVEGIGFMFSSGDSGYEAPSEDGGSSYIQVDWPTSSPWVTSVGGTSLAIGRRSNYEFETAWGTYIEPLNHRGTGWTPPPLFDGAGGGGVSTYFHQPFYQMGVVPASLSQHPPDQGFSATPMRVVPDVSALADPSTGMLVGQTTLQPDGTSYAFSLSRIGGTSVACPTFAGIEADAQQAAGHPLGFANPAIYQRYGTSAFHDVTSQGNLAQIRNNYSDSYTKTGPLVTFLRLLGVDGMGAYALLAATGYDDATGVGSPAMYIQSFQRGRHGPPGNH